MKIEYYFISNSRTKNTWFAPKVKSVTPVSKIREELPTSILNQLSNPPLTQNNISLCIETKNTEAIEYIERLLHKRGFDYDKNRYIEVTKDEVDDYDFFFIGLRRLEWGKQFDYDFTRPTCKNYEACPMGSKITSPVYLRARDASTFSIGKCEDIWNMKVRFIVSQKLKMVFESKNIAGLKYEQCFIGRRDEREGLVEESRESKYCLAEIISTVSEKADDIYLDKRDYCKKHSIIFRYDGLTNRRLPHNAISQNDFQMINRVKVKGKEYYYRIPIFFVSRKVLKILLAQAPSDIRYPMCIYFKEGLTPVPVATQGVFSSDLSKGIAIV